MFTYFFVFWLTISSIRSVVDNQFGTCFSPLPQFSTSFIQACKIKSIKGVYSYKKAGETMVKSENYQLVEFDSIGKMSRFFQINKSGSLIDTTWIEYENMFNGLISVEKIKSGNQFHTKEIQMDSLRTSTEIRFYLETSKKKSF